MREKKDQIIENFFVHYWRVRCPPHTKKKYVTACLFAKFGFFFGSRVLLTWNKCLKQNDFFLWILFIIFSNKERKNHHLNKQFWILYFKREMFSTEISICHSLHFTYKKWQHLTSNTKTPFNSLQMIFSSIFLLLFCLRCVTISSFTPLFPLTQALV